MTTPNKSNTGIDYLGGPLKRKYKYLKDAKF